MIVPILTGIISSILTVKIMNFVNKVQVRESIKNDRLFCSALDNIRFSTDWLLQLFEPILRYYNGPHYNYPGKMKGKFDTVEFAFHDEQMKKITAFYEDNKKDIENYVNNVIITGDNDIIYQMSDKAFIVHNDFKLVGIINDLKSHADFLRDKGYGIKEDELIDEEFDTCLRIGDIMDFISSFYDLIDYLKLRKQYDRECKSIKEEISKMMTELPLEKK